MIQHHFKDLSCRGLTGQASKLYNSIGMHFVLNSSITTFPCTDRIECTIERLFD